MKMKIMFCLILVNCVLEDVFVLGFAIIYMLGVELSMGQHGVTRVDSPSVCHLVCQHR